MQNQTPEIQAKLLAMQRSMVTKPPTPTITTISQPMDDDMDEDSMSSFDSSVEEYKPKVGKQLEVSKDSREDQMRYTFVTIVNMYGLNEIHLKH